MDNDDNLLFGLISDRGESDKFAVRRDRIVYDLLFESVEEDAYIDRITYVDC